MLEQIATYPDNILAIEVVGDFTEADERFCRKLFDAKRDAGNDQVNVLVKLDEAKLSGSSAKAFFENIVWLLRNYTHLGHLAIVAHSKVLKALVPIDALFFERASKGREERYFDVSRMKEAEAFVKGS